ncbi:MAG: glycosyltransferase family 2 protein [Parafilimonas sp.]
MKIHVYAICWNEAQLLPFFIRHYQQFADKIFFCDNESTDNSKNIISSSDKCYYNRYASDNEMRDDLLRQLKNNVWKQSRGKADYVIVVDIDEFVYSKRGLIRDLKILKFLGFSIIRPVGYDMVSESFEWNSLKQITELS